VAIISFIIIGIFALPLLIVLANMFIPLIGTEITPETTVGIINNLQTLIAENQVVFGITILILIIGSVISKLFSIAMKTEVYMQLTKKKRLL
jgi:glutamate mutase epsilon subunit